MWHQGANEKWEWMLLSGKHPKLILLHVLYHEPIARAKLICTFSSKVKKALHPLRSFQHSCPRHAAGSKGFLTSLGKNDSSLLVFSTFPSLRSLGWILRCMFCLGSMWRVYKRSKLCFADDVGELGVDGTLLLIMTDLMCPSLGWTLDGNRLLCVWFLLRTNA